MEKQLKMMEVILYLYDKCKKLVAMNMPMSLLREQDIFEKIISIKYDIPNNQLEKFDDYFKMVDAFYDHLISTNA